MKIQNYTAPSHLETLQNQVSKENVEAKDDGKKVKKYILVGRIIKVMLIQAGKAEQCIAKIPIEQATAEIIAKLEVTSMVDMMMITEALKEGKEGDEEEAPDEIKAYLKHEYKVKE